DGIRDDLVTGVQTCALPIWSAALWASATCAMNAWRRDANRLAPMHVPRGPSESRSSISRTGNRNLLPALTPPDSPPPMTAFLPPDRKSTRLNSSHQIISYAV